MAMACKKRKRSAEHKSMTVDQWLDLPRDPLGEIFNLCNPKDALMALPLVCKYWGRIFLEPIFCKQKDNCLNFMPLEEKPFHEFFYLSEGENIRAMRLMNLLVGVMHAFACDSQSDVASHDVRATPITEITFPRDLPLHDRHLLYVAERCPDLRRILLPCAENITGKGISMAMRCWSCMERMVYGPFNNLYLSRTIEEIGVNCKNLHSILLSSSEFHWQTAELIVRNLKSLKTLSLYRVEISKYGLHIFLSRCKKPIILNFESCFYTNNKDIDESARFRVWNIQEGRRIKWKTDIYSDKMGELYTSKELADLFWKCKK